MTQAEFESAIAWQREFDSYLDREEELDREERMDLERMIIHPTSMEAEWIERLAETENFEADAEAVEEEEHDDHRPQHGPPGEYDIYIGSMEMKGGDGGATIWKYTNPVSGEDMLWINGRRMLDGGKWEFHALMTDTVGDTLKNAQAHIYRQRPGSYVAIHEMWYDCEDVNGCAATYSATINQLMDAPILLWSQVRDINIFNLDIYFSVHAVDID
jgi:hypothetical protein